MMTTRMRTCTIFIKGIERQFSLKTNILDAQKLRTFELHLKDSATANQWWDGLTSTDKDTLGPPGAGVCNEMA
jgi:hypothetical protein